MASKKDIIKRKIKNKIKDILGMNRKLKTSDFDKKNASLALIEYMNREDVKETENKASGRRKDGKDFYPDAKKIATAFDFYRVYLHKYDEIYKDIPIIGEYDGLHSGTPMKTKPFMPCITSVKNLLKSQSLFVYPSTSGSKIARQKFIDYLSCEGFSLKKSENYDGIGIDNVVFMCSTTQAYTMIVDLIARPEDVILTTGPNYGLFTLETERLNAKVELINLKEEDDWYINKFDLAKRIDEINANLKKEYEGKLDYTPKVVAFLNMNPHNPLGKVMNHKNKEILEGIGDVCLEKGVFVIDDLIYRDLTFDHDDLALPLASYKKYFNNTISLFGLSKSFGLASFRSGVVLAPVPIAKGLSNAIFQLMDSTPVVQVESLVGAFNGTSKRYNEYKKYFKPIIEEYKYRYSLFKAMVEGINTITDSNTKKRIIKDINYYESNPKIRKMLLEGVPDTCIRKNTTPESGFFAIIDFTKLKNKKYNDKVIKNSKDLLEYFYIKGKILYLMGDSINWPLEDELVGRVNFALTKEALINNMKIITTSVRELN